MAAPVDRDLAVQKVRQYVRRLRENNVAIWQVYLFGSYANGAPDADSDIDLVVPLDRDEVDIFDEGVRLTRLRRGIDLRIEPRAFGRKDWEDQGPMVRKIVRTG